MPKFEIEKFCAIVQNQKITFAYVVPPLVLLLSKHPVVDKYDLSSLRMMNSGAAPLTREIVDALHKRLKVPVKQGYGLSETSPTTHTQVRTPCTPTASSMYLSKRETTDAVYIGMGRLEYNHRVRGPSPAQSDGQIHV